MFACNGFASKVEVALVIDTCFHLQKQNRFTPFRESLTALRVGLLLRVYVKVRRLIYYVACTVDGFIAGEDGSLDCFLTAGEHLADLLESFPETIPADLRDMLGVRAMNKRFDVVLMGRKTYEVGLEAGITNPYPHREQYLFSGTMRESPDSEVRLVSGDAVALVKELKREAGKDIGDATVP